MATPRKWTQDECDEECDYILHVNPAFPGRNFNNDPESFKDYCRGQAKTIDRAGFPDISIRVRDHAKVS